MSSPLQDLITQIKNLATDIGNALQLRGFKAGGSAGQVPVKTNGTDFNWTWGDAGTRIVVSETAPTDTTAIWRDPEDGVEAFYIGGGWVTQLTGGITTPDGTLTFGGDTLTFGGDILTFTT